MHKLTKYLLIFVVLTCTQINNSIAENLYDEKSFQSLVADKKAFRVGDSLTVIVVEAAKAESRAGTGSEQNFDVAASHKNIDQFRSGTFGVGAQSGGDAVTSRHGFLSAQLAVSVVAVRDNGLLDVTGEQTIIINGEEQKIMISGTLRKQDISKQNTALSNRLTNARIEFSGDGVVADAQGTSVLYKVFQWLGLL